MELIFSQIPQQRNSATAQQRNSATAQQRNSAIRQAGSPTSSAFRLRRTRPDRIESRHRGTTYPRIFLPLPPGGTLQTAFSSFSRKKQAGKWHFFRCPGKNKAPNGIFIGVPVARRLPMPFFTLSAKKQEKKWHFLGCSRQDRPANGIFYVLPGGIPEKMPKNGSFPSATFKMRPFSHARSRNAPLWGQTPTVWDARTPVWPPIAVAHHQSPEPNPTERNTSHGFKSTSR